jgi:hypothetical protein
MPQPESVRKRLQALDGTSFRFERKGQRVFVNDLLVQVQVSEQGAVELVSEAKTVRVSGATYWEIIYDELVPTKRSAGLILAKYDELVERLRRLDTERNQGQRDASETPTPQG